MYVNTVSVLQITLCSLELGIPGSYVQRDVVYVGTSTSTSSYAGRVLWIASRPLGAICYVV